jgi:hypothetical protein
MRRSTKYPKGIRIHYVHSIYIVVLQSQAENVSEISRSFIEIQPGCPTILWASLSITSAPKALLLRPVFAAALSTTRLSACDRYTTNLNGFSDFGRRREMDRGGFIQEAISSKQRNVSENGCYMPDRSIVRYTAIPDHRLGTSSSNCGGIPGNCSVRMHVWQCSLSFRTFPRDAEHVQAQR